MSSVRTVKGAKAIHGKDPQLLVEKIIRERIYDCAYFKHSCNTLDVSCLAKLANELCYIGGIYGNTKPTPFLCLLQKLLQVQPAKDELLGIYNSGTKYAQALIGLYVRMTFASSEVYRFLEPVLADYRKLRQRVRSGTFEITTMDQFVDQLLVSDRACDIILPRITKRRFLVERGDLQMRSSAVVSGSDLAEDDGFILDGVAAHNAESLQKAAPSSSKIKWKSSEQPPADTAGVKSMSIEETNALRAQLGMKPLSR